MMKICNFFTNDRNVCACLDTSVVALRAPPRQAHTNQPNELNPKRREIGRHADPLVPARFFPVALFGFAHLLAVRVCIGIRFSWLILSNISLKASAIGTAIAYVFASSYPKISL